MPELPEVETVKRELHNKLTGLKIQSVLVLTSNTISLGAETVSNIRKVKPQTVKLFEKILRGQKFLSVNRRAKLLLFNLDKGWNLLVHLKMTGQFIFEDKKLQALTKSRYRLLNKISAPLIQLPSKHTHVVFRFTNGSVLYFNDVRKFGYIKMVKNTDLSLVKEFSTYGPEPLTKEFTLQVFLSLVKKLKPKKVSIKQQIMDNNFVVGIGNIYSDEILFQAGVKPQRPVNSLSLSEWESIYKWIRPILKKGIQAKGSSVGDFVRTDGSWGKMGKFHFVYGRSKRDCKKCGTIIQSQKLGGRTASFCPKCQK